MSLKISYQGNDFVVEEGSSVLIGAGETSQIRIARPGISRSHAVVAFDGAMWKVEDAGSRNGTFLNGERIHVTPLDGPTTLVLGHPTDGEEVTFVPVVKQADTAATLQADIDAFVLPDSPPPAAASRERTAPVAAATAAAPTPRQSQAAGDPDALTAAIRDQINAIKGLTWSVWAMIAVTAALCVLTLFVGVLGS